MRIQNGFIFACCDNDLDFVVLHGCVKYKEIQRKEKKMKKIFIGLFFILLDFNLRYPTGTENTYYIIGLLPSFIGFILIALGLKKLAGRNRFFAMGVNAAWLMTGVTLVNYVLNATGLAFRVLSLSLILGVVAVVGTVALPFVIIRGAKEEEIRTNTSWNTRQMMRFWTFYAAFVVLQNIMAFMPVAQVYMFVMLGTYVAVGGLLVAFGKVKNIA